MQKDRIALQLYTVREDLKRDCYAVLKQVKEMGYSGVEFAGLNGWEPQAVKDMCQTLGLTVLSDHVSFALLAEDPEKIIADCKNMGCKYVAISYLPEAYRPDTPGFQQVLDTLPSLAEAVKQAGMELLYHNHDFEFTKVQGEYALDIIYNSVAPGQMQAQIDTCWAKVAGEDPVAYLKKHAGRYATVHLKDFAGYRVPRTGAQPQEKPENAQPFEFRPLGKGVQDLPAIIEAARQGGAEWFIVEQDTPSLGYTPLESAEVSIRYLLEQL